MSEVKTYAVNCNDAWLNTDGDDISGSYVKYKDYQEMIATLEAKCAALAAENAAMKADHVRIFNSGYQRGHEATVEGYFVDIHQNDITTYHEDIVAEIEEEQAPATDAFLAEIERKATSKFINSIEHILRDKLSPYDTEEMLEAMRIFLEEQSGEQK